MGRLRLTRLASWRAAVYAVLLGLLATPQFDIMGAVAQEAAPAVPAVPAAPAAPAEAVDGSAPPLDPTEEEVKRVEGLVADSRRPYQYDEMEEEMDELDTRCTEYDFPIDSFKDQTDTSKVYLKVSSVGDGPFKDQSLTKYLTVFGVRIVGHRSVDDSKLTHTANLVAQLLDADADGVVDSASMQEQLLDRYATMFIVSDQGYTNYLLSDEEGVGFPMELKYCPFSFDYEETSKIQPNGPVEASCPEDLFTKDRSAAFASDHLVGRGWPKLLIDKEEEMATSPVFQQFTSFYRRAIEDQTFDLDKTGCPDDDAEYCGMVMFASWAVTSYLGIDKCWCQSVGAWKLCDEKAATEKYPELTAFVEQYLVKSRPDGRYSPSDPSVILRGGDDSEEEEVTGPTVTEGEDDVEVKVDGEEPEGGSSSDGEGGDDDAGDGEQKVEEEL